MLRGNGTKIIMTEGDFGVTLPIIINGGDVGDKDTLRITIKQESDGESILSKEFTNIKNNTFEFVLSKEESDKLPIGKYLYSLDWYRGNEFFCNLIKKGLFEVEDKI